MKPNTNTSAENSNQSISSDSTVPSSSPLSLNPSRPANLISPRTGSATAAVAAAADSNNPPSVKHTHSINSTTRTTAAAVASSSSSSTSTHPQVVTSTDATSNPTSLFSYPLHTPDSPLQSSALRTSFSPLIAPSEPFSSPAPATLASSSTSSGSSSSSASSISSPNIMSIQGTNPFLNSTRINAPEANVEWGSNDSDVVEEKQSKDTKSSSSSTQQQQHAPNITNSPRSNPTLHPSSSALTVNPSTPVGGDSKENRPASSTSASASAAAANRRKAMVQGFIRSGESNIVFREKAPSIVPNESGVFYAPASAARAAERERERERDRDAALSPLLASSSFASQDRSGNFMPIPLGGMGGSNRDGLGSANSPGSGSGSPRRFSALSSSPMGISSRQLMFQLSSNASTASAVANVSAASAAQNARLSRRGSGHLSLSGVGSGVSSPYPTPNFNTSARSDSRGSEDDSPAGSAGSSVRDSSPGGFLKRFSFFGGNSSPNSKADTPSSARKQTMRDLNRPLLSGGGATGGGSSSSAAVGVAARGAGGLTNRSLARLGTTRGISGGSTTLDHEFEEARRKEEEREATLMAPFLEARGNEDFVTYDLTRQQDYHKQRKEMTKERFRRWTKGKKNRRHSHKAVEMEEEHGSGGAVGAASADAHDEQQEQNGVNGKKTKSFSAAAGGDGGGGGGDDSSSSSDDYDSEDEVMDVQNSTRSQRCIRRFVSLPPVRGVMKMFLLGQSWIICGFIGALTGLLAAVVDLAAQWLIDLKSGYCSDALYLSNSFCCAGSPQWVGGTAQPLLLMCDQWKNWDRDNFVHSTIAAVVSPFFAAYFMYVLLGVSFAAISAWLVLYYAPHASGSGIPEIKTILGGVVVKKYLGGWTLMIKCIALVLSVGSGLSLGKEGGFIHISCCVANILSRYFPEFKKNQYKKNEAVSAAAAAGISVAFGAPVGGVLFSLEEIASFFPHKTMWRAFFCAIIASIVLQSIDPYQEGRLVLFQIDYNKTWYWFEMIPFVLLGVLGGLMGHFFIWLTTKLAQFRKKSFLHNHPVVEVIMVAFITVLLKYLSAYMRGNNNSVLASLFGDCKDTTYYDPLGMCDTSTTWETIANLLFLCFATYFFTIFAWSLCVPGGVFVPALIVGASLGRAMGTMMRSWQLSSYALSLFQGCNPFTPGIYALVGAASMLGGVTRMTVCLVVIMFEITGGLAYLLPIMVGLMFSKLVGDAFDRRSIFEAHLILNKYPFLNSKDRIPPKIRVSDAMSRDLLALPMHGHTVESLTDQLALLGELRITGFPIVTTLKDRFIVGYINRSELYTALCLALRNPEITPQTRCYFAMLSLRFPRNDPYVDLRPWLHPSPIQVVEHTPLYRVHDLFKKLGTRYALVTNFGKLTGIITKKDILNAINKQQEADQQKKEKNNNNRKGPSDEYKRFEAANAGATYSIPILSSTSAVGPSSLNSIGNEHQVANPVDFYN